MIVYIYNLTDPRQSSIRYVGLTRYPAKRYRNELSRGHTLHFRNWVESLRKVGLRPTMNIIQTVDENTASEAEREWIAWYLSMGCALLNVTEGGEIGYRVSEETREKLRQVQLRRKHRGPLSEEHKRKLSLANRGRLFNPKSSELCRKNHEKLRGVPLTPEHRKKVSDGVRRSMTEDVRRKMSISHQGKRPYIMTDATRQKISESLKRRFTSEAES